MTFSYLGPRLSLFINIGVNLKLQKIVHVIKLDLNEVVEVTILSMKIVHITEVHFTPQKCLSNLKYQRIAHIVI